jgi:hypothetical protein
VKPRFFSRTLSVAVCSFSFVDERYEEIGEEGLLIFSITVKFLQKRILENQCGDYLNLVGHSSDMHNECPYALN